MARSKDWKAIWNGSSSSTDCCREPSFASRWRKAPATSERQPQATRTTVWRRGDDPVLTAHPIDPLIGPQDIDPDDLDTRAALAAAIYKAGGLAIAATELDKILMLDPNQLRARIAHMTQELELDHFSAARDDLDVVMSHDELRDYLCSGSKNSTPLVLAAQQFATRGLTEEAMRIADKLVRSGFELGVSPGVDSTTRVRL